MLRVKYRFFPPAHIDTLTGIMIRNISLVAVVALTIAWSPFAPAQIIESGSELTPQFGETSSLWRSSGGIRGYQEWGFRPYVPYPGQPGHSVGGSFQQPLQTSTSFGFVQPFESFAHPMNGYVQPFIEIPQSTASSFESFSGSNQEIIISAEPVDGRIIGVVQKDGSIIPIGQSGIPSQPMTSELGQSASVVGELIVQPASEPGIVLLGSDQAPSKNPGTLEVAGLEPTPNVSQQEVVDARNKQMERFQARQTRMREMDREIVELKFRNDTQSAAMATSKAALAKLSLENEERLNASEQSFRKTQKDLQRKIADLQHKNKRLVEKLDAAKQKSKESADTRSQTSTLRRKIVDANRELVKMRRSLDDSAENIERLKRNRGPSSAAAKLKAELDASKEANVALERAMKVELSDVRKDNSAKVSKLKKDLAKAQLTAEEMQSKFAEMKKAISNVSDDKKKYDDLAKSHSKSIGENKASKKRMQEMAAKLKTMETKHAEAIAKLGKEYKASAETQRDALTALKAAKSELAEQKKMNTQLKTDFMEAFEADKKNKEDARGQPKTEAEVREAWIKKRREAEKAKQAEKAKKSKQGKSSKKAEGAKNAETSNETHSDKEADSKKEAHKEKPASSAEAKLHKRQEQLRDEMKKKMAEAESRILAVGKKKVEALLKRGKKEDSDEVKAEKERTEDSVRISDRKIRARYERKIKRLK